MIQLIMFIVLALLESHVAASNSGGDRRGERGERQLSGQHLFLLFSMSQRRLPSDVARVACDFLALPDNLTMDQLLHGRQEHNTFWSDKHHTTISYIIHATNQNPYSDDYLNYFAKNCFAFAPSADNIYVFKMRREGNSGCGCLIFFQISNMIYHPYTMIPASPAVPAHMDEWNIFVKITRFQVRVAWTWDNTWDPDYACAWSPQPHYAHDIMCMRTNVSWMAQGCEVRGISMFRQSCCDKQLQSTKIFSGFLLLPEPRAIKQLNMSSIDLPPVKKYNKSLFCCCP